MKRQLTEKLALILMFIVFYILLELVTFTWLGFDILPEYFMIDLAIIFVISSVAFLFKSHKSSRIYLGSLMVLFVVLSLINETMNMELNGEIFSIYSLTLAGEAMKIFTADYIHLDTILPLIAILSSYFILNQIIVKSLFKTFQKAKGYHYKIFPVYLGFLLIFVSMLGLTNAFKHYNEIYNVSLFKRESLSQYGLTGFYFKEIDIMFFNGDHGDHTIGDLEDDLIVEYPSLYDEEDLEIPYAGLLDGKNVITIMLESGQGFAMNEVLTPNLWRVTHEGLYFPNNYSENKTNVSELIGIIGHYPSEGINSRDYHYDFRYSMAEILNEKGYHTAYFHENVETFYNRRSVVNALGFQEVVLHEELFPDEEIYGWGGDYTLDSRTMDRMMDFMFQEEDGQPFYYYWTTLVMHGPYNRNYPSDRGINNLQKFTNLGYFDLIDQAEANGDWINILEDSEDPQDPGRYRFYQAAMMDFDVALGMLLDTLEDKDLLDDTIIMIYGDHNLYYHQMNLRINGVEEGDIEYVDMYKTFFAIYNPILTNAYLTNRNTTDTYIDKFVSPYDILPTYFHLMDIPYFENFTLGESVLTNRETVFYSGKMTAFFNQEYFSFNNEEIAFPEDIVLNQDALDFLNQTSELTDKILWLELWTNTTRQPK